MSAPAKGTSGNAAVSSGPINGSFPVDRLHECSSYIQQYFSCLKKHNNYAPMCRKETKEYLKCRRDHGLMTRRDYRDAQVAGEEDGFVGADDETQSVSSAAAKRGSAEGIRDFDEWKRKKEINSRLSPKGF